MPDFVSERRGSAVRWFAVAAVVVCVGSLASAHGLDWLSQSGRISFVAYRAPAPATNRSTAAAGPGVDMTPTGSVPTGSALVIRIR